MNYKLVALDVDGTLINKERQITPRTKAAINQVREIGVEVTLCTGRMFAGTSPYAKELELELPLVSYNGALVMDYRTKEVLYQRLLPNDYAAKIIEEARRRKFTINYYHEDRLLVEEITEQNQSYSQWTGVPLEQVKDLAALAYEPTKLLLIGEQEPLDAYWQEAQGTFGKAVYITKSWPIFLEFLNPEATKGLGLAALVEHLGVERDQVMCIGDSHNDLEMFSYSGLAVAMGNAGENVKKAADYVTTSNEEDGVARALEKFIIEAEPLSQVK